MNRLRKTTISRKVRDFADDAGFIPVRISTDADTHAHTHTCLETDLLSLLKHQS